MLTYEVAQQGFKLALVAGREASPIQGHIIEELVVDDVCLHCAR